MCCFAQPIVRVDDTRLFARLTDRGSQYLVYQMRFESKTENAMILPLPVTRNVREDSVRFVSLKGYERFFNDLDRGFPEPPPPTVGISSRMAPASEAQVDPLVVHEVGEFVASFVPTIQDFGRLDPKFVIAKESWDQLPEYSDYGFAVFQLKSLSGEPHPMAFEFDTRWPDKIFFPTVHIHDGQVHEFEDFDHRLYMQSSSYDQCVGPYRGHRERDPSTGFVRSKTEARNYCRISATQGIVDPDLLVHRQSMRGRLLNRDVIRDQNIRSKGNGLGFHRSFWPIIPGVFGIAGLAWILERRMRLQRSRIFKNQ